jgi:hypothetical protein
MVNYKWRTKLKINKIFIKKLRKKINTEIEKSKAKRIKVHFL